MSASPPSDRRRESASKPPPLGGDDPGAPAFVAASTRDWPAYFEAVAGKPPRETLLEALDRFRREGVAGASAIDLGCGEGRDTVELLRRGWRVAAIDGHPEAIGRLAARPDLTGTERLMMRLATLEAVELTRATLVNASFTLPFCRPDAFAGLWSRIWDALEPGGRFAGQLFGDRDSWAVHADRSHQTRGQVDELLAGREIEMLKEEESDAADAHGQMKHWHVYHVVARKPPA